MSGLGYAGLLPFYGAAVWVCLPLPGLDLAARIFVVYGAVILAFLGGTLWGYAVTLAPPVKYQRLVLSNLVALFAAIAALAGSALVSVILLAVGQLSLLAYEWRNGDRRGWYLVLRRRLSLGVMPAHILMLVGLVRGATG